LVSRLPVARSSIIPMMLERATGSRETNYAQSARRSETGG